MEGKIIYFSMGLIVAGLILIGSEYAHAVEWDCDIDEPKLYNIEDDDTSFHWEFDLWVQDDAMCHNEFGNIMFIEPKILDIVIIDVDYEYVVHIGTSPSDPPPEPIILMKEIWYKYQLTTSWVDSDRNPNEVKYVEDNYNNLIEDTGVDYQTLHTGFFKVDFEG